MSKGSDVVRVCLQAEQNTIKIVTFETLYVDNNGCWALNLYGVICQILTTKNAYQASMLLAVINAFVE